jgi:hypothetical protein
VAEETKTDRRRWLELVGGAAVGAVGGYFVGKSTVPDPERPPDVRATNAVDFSWRLEIRGGYGWLFYKNSNTVRIMSLKASTCPWYDHKMMLIVSKQEAVPDGGTCPMTTVGDYYIWELDGETTFTEGLGNNSVKKFENNSEWDKLKSPYAPERPDEVDYWNDSVWLSESVAANPNADKLASRSIIVPDGNLSVLKPTNEWGVYCNWLFKDKQGNERRKALTDRIQFTKDLTATRIGLNTDGGTIYLKPFFGRLRMAIRHKLELAPIAFEKDDPLPHFAMLYDFSNIPCKDAVVPTLEEREGYKIPEKKNASPGDLCPPLMLHEA